MKKKSSIVVLLISTLSVAQVAIGTTSLDPTAVLQLSSADNSKGFLPPRLSSTERSAITSPAAGLTIYNTSLKCLEVYNGLSWNCEIPKNTSDAYNPTTGKIWMDRNLGATQVATAYNDHLAYGSLFQWGRLADGHQEIIWTNATTGVGRNGNFNGQSSGNVPGYNKFIKWTSGSKDWRTTPNNNLWQGVDGINNPCPSGYRLPTETEWLEERSSWSSYNYTSAFASPLKLTSSGYRDFDFVQSEGSVGYYWSSTVSATGLLSRYLQITSTTAVMVDYYRAYGLSVRCIKN
jgi:uncharacterized protein (TIGR02145 family)